MKSSPRRTPPVPAWIFWVLMIAGIYNLAWGTFVILFPALPFEWLGITAPNYLSLVQCIGMIVGVYGIGYAIAAYDPARHWPIVLVGLLGKIFGPIGFLYTAIRGELPWAAGLTILTNDLSWWIPFIAILLYAIRENDCNLSSDIDERSFTDQLQSAKSAKSAKSATGETLLELSQRSQTLVVFLRHAGCTYCRETLDKIHQEEATLAKNKTLLAIVHMGPTSDGELLAKQYKLPQAFWFSDSDRHLYRAFDLRLGTLTQLFGLRVWWRAFVQGTLMKYGFGPIRGNGLQMPGTFLIKDGQIQKAFRHQTAGDHPNYAEMACPV